jgi:hypothetical protein
MSQHDYDIANQSFPAFRTDLNNVLGAINSSNSGTSRPSSATTGTIWLDTTNSGSNSLSLKFYDGAQDIELATVDTSANTVNFLDSVVGGVSFKEGGTNFTNSLLVGHSTTGTLSSAERNTGVGVESLDAITSGDDNTAVGYLAGSSITSGTNNTFVGKSAGDSVTTSGSNVGMGFYTLSAISTGANNNVAIGRSAMKDSNGSNCDGNVAIGSSALEDVTGANNIGIGETAGDNITSGAGNVIIGVVDADSATGSRQLKIAGYDGSTTTTWIDGNSSGVVTFNGANVTQQALTSSSNAVAWDSSAKPNAYHLTTENTTFSAPSNAVEGAFICIEINYNGSHTIAFNTVFEFAGSTAPTFTSTDAKTDILVFKYNGAIWQEVGRTLNLSES